MKKTILLTTMILFSIVSYSQDVIDPYDSEQQEGVTFNNNVLDFDGEYQIDISILFWLDLIGYDHIFSYTFECVSFPFVPDCINLGSPNSSCVTGTSGDRDFVVLPDNYYDYEDELIDNGSGWISESTGHTIYNRTDPDIFNNHDMSQPAGLVSYAYFGTLDFFSRKTLPHTVLRMTLNVHSGTSLGDSIVLKQSWLYDNTRGRMNFYPFLNTNGVIGGGSDPPKYDVVFLPHFEYETDSQGNSTHTYSTTTNIGWFTGAYPPSCTSEPLGSISYYPSIRISDKVNIIYPPPIPEPPLPDYPFPSLWCYPAPYSLLSPPLLNAQEKAYAGFDNSGQISSSVQGGKEHNYFIDEPIDLTIINPDEKIIYNPSKVEIDCDLTFPEDYKFLTVHGKYPDKAWVMENNTGFTDLRDVLCPSDQIDENGGFLSEYIVNNILTIETGVTIMDAQINGTGTVRYYPDDISGNFKLSPNLKLEFLSDQIIINDPFVSWENEIDFQGSLISIEPGATLEIKNTLGVGNNTKIIVKRGGKLIIDGGRIIAQSGLWQGILVYGTSNQPQNNEYQGRVEILNDGTIINAVCAISTIKYSTPTNPEDDPTPDYYFTGGMVLCDGAIFKNNGTAVKFWDYGYATSYSLFHNCQFITNDELMADADPGYFIEMDGIDGIQIGTCNFTDTRDVIATERISGILSHETKSKVFASSTFTGLYYGIKAYAHGPGKFISIKNTFFDDNSRGVYISGMSNAEVTDNNFNINSPYSSFNGGYGLYLDHSTAYKVEDNNFYHEGAVLGVGLIVNQSGGKPNQIYRNYFTDLQCGMDIQGENRNQNGSGLVLKCNQYENTFMDKIITWDIPISTPEAGIAISQGSPGSNPEDMAGNLFYVPGPSNDDYDDILNEANTIVYYYPNNAPGFADRVEPIDYTHNTVEPIEVSVFPSWSYENGCPPSEEPGGGGGIGVIKGKMAVADNKTDSTENLLSILIDGGNTEATQTDVDNSIPPETMQVYNELMAKSPYLSDTVVSTAIEKEDVLPGAMLRDIMVANPNTAKSEKLMQKLDERWDPLPEYMKAQILAGRSIVSIREETESRLAAFKLEREKHFNALARYYINDTIDPVGSKDSLMALYVNDNSLSAKYVMAYLNGDQGDWVMGLGILNNIPVQFELSAKEANTHSQMLLYYNLLLDLAQEGKSIFEVDEAQKTTLLGIESTNAGSISAYSRNILLALGEIDYEEPIILPDMLKSSSAEAEYGEMLSKTDEAPNYIKVQPNPAKDYIILAYDLEKEGGATVDIHNINAKLKFSKNLISKQDQITIDTREWKAGVYIVTLKINGKLVEGVKFTVID